MKTFKLNRVKYKNIMSVGDSPIDIELSAVHKTLITGTNGAGKSTMLEAITFALFGKSFRDIKKGQLLNTDTKKNLLVELWLDYNNSTYYIKRGIKPNVFEVLKDDEPLDVAASSKDFQTEFEQMIGMNYNSYKQVVVLGTAGYTPFMGLTAANRRKLVEDLLDVTVLADMDKLNKAAVKDINTSVSLIDQSINHTQTQIETHLNYAERQRKLSGDNIGRLEAMKQVALDEIAKIKANNKVLNDKILSVDVGEDVSEESHNSHRLVVQSEGELNQTVRVLTLYQKGGSCPTCLQQLSDESLVNKIEESRARLEAEHSRLKDLHADIHSRKVAHLNAKEEIRKYENQIATNRQLAVQQVDRIGTINSALAEASKEFVDNSEEISMLKDTLNDSISKKSELVMEKHRRSLINEMLKDSGIKGSIIKRYLPIFNKQINHYLNLLEADYSFELNEEFNETIKSRGKEDFSYTSFSQGEKGRIDLALMFTWRDIAEKLSGVKISCLFLDEIYDSAMDAQGAKNISSVLNTMPEANIFIISHRDHNPEDYGQWLRMRKVGRFTTMEANK